MNLLARIKKYLVGVGLAISLFSTMNISAFAAAPIQQVSSVENGADKNVIYASEIPKDAVIVSETEQVLYFDEQTGEELPADEALQRSGSVFNVTAKHTIFQVPGGKVDLGIDITASDTRARLKGINGWMNVDDLDASVASSQKIKASTIVPTYHFGAYVDGTKSFARGHSVQVTWSYNISVVGGSVPSAITGDEEIDIVR